MRKYRYLLLLGITALVIIWMVMFPQNILRFFYPLRYNDFVFKYSEYNKIDPYLVMAIIKVESNFNANAQSHKGAKGLMQITDQTALWGAEQLGLHDFRIDKLFDPETNIQIGCWYLNNLKKEFNNDLLLVLTAYNGGSGNVAKWLKDKNLSRSGKSLDRIPFKETDLYVKKVLKEYNIYKRLYADMK
ncbi:lytic transglycosylase domain-containing protein [Petroclostridium xylanilyticum]|jgi:soluble lytic murein transglycosylase|uniref:lytic transglycosylase domain-containing protein n=1 Tax=Petroclostridium xylanilyticum TaxID=1792311 RepID=UPI000B990B08|nr:lytic transglycosylase domain-containing protein [Petroclostridium xylanilyticum]